MMNRRQYDSVEPESRFYAKNLGENPDGPVTRFGRSDFGQITQVSGFQRLV